MLCHKQQSHFLSVLQHARMVCATCGRARDVEKNGSILTSFCATLSFAALRRAACVCCSASLSSSALCASALRARDCWSIRACTTPTRPSHSAAATAAASSAQCSSCRMLLYCTCTRAGEDKSHTIASKSVSCFSWQLAVDLISSADCGQAC